MVYQSPREDLSTRLVMFCSQNRADLVGARVQTAQSGLSPVWWRAFERLASLLGLIILSPLILTLMALVRMTSSGPALLAQHRVGRNGKTFVLFKLRTMFQGTYAVPTHTVPLDAFTPFGLFLRRWKLDELPQLYNVLIGDMSLVGPRPSLTTQTELIAERWRTGALRILPGMTGLAQVQNIDMSDVQRLAAVDAEYLRTRTIFGDVKLILRTFSSIRN